MSPRRAIRACTLALALGATVSLLGIAAGCRSRGAEMPRDYQKPLILGGRTVAPETLRRGGDSYTHYCRPCHGAEGDGKGPASPGQRPPPRDLRLGLVKFAAVAAGQLPSDADLTRIIKAGLHGTAMLPWDVPHAEIDALIQYVKAFSPRWQSEKPGDPIVASPDPWRQDPSGGVERGKKVYHGMAQCAVACHPAYVTKPEIQQFTKELTKMETLQFRDDLYQPVAKDSDYGVKILPTDFAYHRLRSGETLDDIYRSIAAGIGGTAMPTWKGVLPEEDLWAMAHYVRSLVLLRGTTQAEELRARLLTQPVSSPPPPSPPSAPDGGRAVGDGRAD
jgi:mono/diheme cytochrome c family protein